MADRMSDDEVMRHIRQDTSLNQLRTIFYCEAARIEQARGQRRPASPIEVRRMEFEAVQRIAAAVAALTTGDESVNARVTDGVDESLEPG